MLQPARRKYRKEQKGRNKGIATRGTKVSFGAAGSDAFVATFLLFAIFAACGLQHN